MPQIPPEEDNHNLDETRYEWNDKVKSKTEKVVKTIDSTIHKVTQAEIVVKAKNKIEESKVA